LLAEFDRTLDVVGGDMDNTDPDLRHGPSGLTEGSSGSFLPVISPRVVVDIIPSIRAGGLIAVNKGRRR
jgi:hypothetical protein